MLIPPSLRSGLLAFVAVCALVALPIGAAVPGQVDFQGLLLDSNGEKVNGAVDLVFTLYDAPTGGSALWTESHADVPLSDGVYGVTLGATTPLTQAELASGNVFLEISVEGETLTPRRQLLAVPYAVRAETAESLGGASSAYFTQILDNVSFDGGAPDNRDPSEGTADVDGDGLANFIDSDNDGDGFSDTDELAQGSDINLPTPVVTGFDPPVGFPDEGQTVTVLGQGFEPGLSVSIGTQNPVPTNVTATSFEVTLAAEPISALDVTVTNANGQTAALASYSFRHQKVFLAAGGPGDLGGVAGADAQCAAKAADLGLPGVFLAWISDSSTSPAARFTQSTHHYELLDGTKIADDWADLTDGTIDVPIDPSAGGTSVWTGTGADGNPLGGSCADWTDGTAASSGRRGVPTSFSSQWSAAASDALCTNSYALYCFDQR